MRRIATVLIAYCALSAWADGLKDLEDFVRNTKSGRAEFTLAAAPDAQGQQWVLATPKAKDGQLQSVRIGFRAGALAALEILDSFGQKSVLSFGNFQANAALDASHFQFKPPPGADVIRQ